jgi:hypothetical protein
MNLHAKLKHKLVVLDGECKFGAEKRVVLSGWALRLEMSALISVSRHCMET